MTYADVKNLFSQYNTEFFGGVLPAIEIKLESRKTSRLFGQYRYSSRFGMVTRKIRIFPLAINAGHAEETLYHEMVHYYLHLNGYPCGHTPRFKALMSKFLGKRVTNRFIQKTLVPQIGLVPQMAMLQAMVPMPVAPMVTVSGTSIGEYYQGQKIVSLETKNGIRIALKLENTGWVKI